jgi:SPX domain protein involved in polyphosphate accumulation
MKIGQGNQALKQGIILIENSLMDFIRFSIKEKYVNEFLSGKYTMDKSVEKMRARKVKSDKELDDALQLSREIQNTILTKGLKPMVSFNLMMILTLN